VALFLVHKVTLISGTEWPFICWCAVKNLLTHSLIILAQLRWWFNYITLVSARPAMNCIGQRLLMPVILLLLLLLLILILILLLILDCCSSFFGPCYHSCRRQIASEHH